VLKAQSEKEKLFQKIKNLNKQVLVTMLLLLVLIFLISNFVIPWVLTIILKTSQPLYTPISGSMEPTLRPNVDLLIVQGGVTGENLYAHLGDGDIIIFHPPSDYNGKSWVHRAVDKYEVNDTWYIVTKGDNNGNDLYDWNATDNWVYYGFPKGGLYDKAGFPESYIVGKVIFCIPYLAAILSKIDEPIIFGLTLRHFLIIVVLIAFVYLELTDSNEKEPKKAAEKPENDGKRRNEPLSINCSL